MSSWQQLRGKPVVPCRLSHGTHHCPADDRLELAYSVQDQCRMMIDEFHRRPLPRHPVGWGWGGRGKK